MREMKDSGIEWIGNVPATWERCKIKNVISSIGSGTTPTSSNIDYYNSEDICWIQSGDLYKTSYISNTAVSLSAKALHLSALQIYAAPFIVVAMYGASVGNIAISTIDACSNQACCCIKPDNNNDLKFMYYWLSMCKIDFLSQSIGGGQPNISQSKIKNQFYYRPQLSEQKVIANFLDSKCSEIDAISADIQKEIEILEQYKRSLVFEAISKGINGEKTANASSDIWKEIPQSWKLVDIKYLFEIVKRIAGREGYNILSVTQKGLKVKDISGNQGQIAENYSGYQFVFPSDYVMNHMDLLTGWIDCSDQFGVTSPDYRVFRLRDKTQNDTEYYKYVMQCCYMCRIFYSLGQGVSTLGRWRLQTSAFMNFKVPVPPLHEQKEIARYLNDKCKEIELSIEQKRKQLELLSAYKKSLIYEYVTGKKEVI